MSGDSGEAGNGSTVNHSLPVQTTISSVTGIAAGDYHSLAVKSNGSVWASGYNGSGQIGDNTTTERDSPVQVSGLSGSMTAVAAGQEFSYALKSDGTVRAWGYGGDGEMGDNCWCDRHTPVEVHGVNNSGYLTGISGLGQSNGYFALAYSSSGVGYTWGMNQYGQLGDDGWRQGSGTPIQVVGLKGFSNLAGGGGHSLGITSPSRTTTTYTYDDLYRLTGAANTSRTTTYGYDPLGNRSQMVRGSTTTNYSYDESDRITQTQVVGGSTTSYTVNAAGDVTARGSDSFSYDQANRLTSATVGGTTVTFVYDGDGNLYSKTVGGTTTRYVYDVAGGMARLLDDGTRRTVWGVGLAYTLDDSGGAINVYHTDGLGSVRAQTNSSASVVATWGTDEFGVVDSSLTTGSSTQQLQYTGELRDPTTSFVDLRARWYDPSTGRFVSRDTFPGGKTNPQSLNRYAYALNNGTSLRDPSGLCVDPGGNGIRYCIEAYIPQDSVLGFTGDNRRYPEANGGTFRLHQWLTPDSNGGLAENHAAGLSILGPISRPGDVYEDSCYGHRSYYGNGKSHILAQCTASDGLAFELAPALQYQISLTEMPDGTVHVDYANGTEYPSLEVYQYGGPTGGPDLVFFYDSSGSGKFVQDIASYDQGLPNSAGGH